MAVAERAFHELEGGEEGDAGEEGDEADSDYEYDDTAFSQLGRELLTCARHSSSDVAAPVALAFRLTLPTGREHVNV